MPRAAARRYDRGMALCATKAVLFDLDGTLLNTLDDLAASMNAVLGRLSLPDHAADAYKLFVGEGLATLVARALPPGSDEALRSRALGMMRQEYAARMEATTEPYPGVPELLDRLGAMGVGMAVLSNKPDAAVAALVPRYFPGVRFGSLRGQREGFPRKPDPAGALAVAEEMALSPGSFAYLGDSAVDMRTARAAGMKAIGALWGFRSAKELEEGGAEYLIAEPIELFTLL